jgi:hypothetical protein
MATCNEPDRYHDCALLQPRLLVFVCVYDYVAMLLMLMMLTIKMIQLIPIPTNDNYYLLKVKEAGLGV